MKKVIALLSISSLLLLASCGKSSEEVVVPANDEVIVSTEEVVEVENEVVAEEVELEVEAPLAEDDVLVEETL